MADPFTKLFGHCWSAAEADTEFCTLVSVANRIKFNSATNRDPEKETVTDSDLPEVILVPGGVGSPMAYNSSMSKITINLMWLVSTGDLRVTYRAYPVLFRLICIVDKLEKNSASYTFDDGVTRIESIGAFDASIADLNSEQNRSIIGWSSVAGFSVDLLLPRNFSNA